MDMQSLEQKRSDVFDEIKSLGDMRRGSLAERYIRCGKAGCHCTKVGSKGHGPSYSLTRKVKGKTVTKYLRVEQVEQVQEQIRNRRQFGRLLQEFLEVNEAICDLRLEEKSVVDRKKNLSRR